MPGPIGIGQRDGRHTLACFNLIVQEDKHDTNAEGRSQDQDGFSNMKIEIQKSPPPPLTDFWSLPILKDTMSNLSAKSKGLKDIVNHVNQ